MARIVSRIGRIIRRILGGRRVTPTRWRWGYRCTFIDDSTGDEIVSVWRVVETNSPTNYQQASAQARRDAWALASDYVSRQLIAAGNVSLRCERRGDVIGLP